jgi:hypothetical protein
MAIAQEISPEPETATTETADETADTTVADSRRPASATGDLVGDFFTVSLTACSLDTEVLVPNNEAYLAERGIVSARSISQERLSRPSLWWVREKFAQEKLVQTWFVDVNQRNIDLIVDHTQWSNMTSLSHYRVVHQYGMIAHREGYQLRIFNSRPKCLAIYDCPPEMSAENRCKVDLQPSRRDPFNFF